MNTTGLYLILFILSVTYYSRGYEISTLNGRILGREVTTVTNITFYAFQDVPYAKPPVGDLRFEPPQPVDNWEGVLDTTSNKRVCYQSGNSIEDEDCLLLNIYTPVQKGENASLPVFVMFHGGGFMGGSGRFVAFGPDFFMEYDIIVITVNYRIGAFGFLSTGDLVVPGNNGLKDQTLALKWIQANIAKFGGDPNKVTIDGQSAGAASVGFHIVSKLSEGLFRAGIAESGTPLCAYTIQAAPKAMAYKLAAGINASFTENQTTRELVNFLRTVSPTDILKVSFSDVDQGIGKGYIFTPVIEDEHDGAFLSEHTHTLLETGNINRVPLLIGFNSEESISVVNNLDSFRREMAGYDENPARVVKLQLNVPDVNKTAFASKAKSIYIKEGQNFVDDLGASVRFYSDNRYTTSITRHAVLQSKYSDVYLYQLSYEGVLGGNSANIEGAETVSHSENLRYIWAYDDNRNITKYSAEDVQTHKRLMKIYQNFIYTTNPTPEKDELLQNIVWPKVTEDNIQYVDIDDNIIIKTGPKHYEEWKNIINEYAKPPFDIY